MRRRERRKGEDCHCGHCSLVLGLLFGNPLLLVKGFFLLPQGPGLVNVLVHGLQVGHHWAVGPASRQAPSLAPADYLHTVITCHLGVITRREERADFLKANFFCASNISVQMFCANKMGQKPTKNLKKWPKKGKTVVNCAFLRSKAQILRNVWKFLRDRTVARSHLLETL